jgi:hypothetical protein
LAKRSGNEGFWPKLFSTIFPLVLGQGRGAAKNYEQ